jgi:hypothetical protein
MRKQMGKKLNGLFKAVSQINGKPGLCEVLLCPISKFINVMIYCQGNQQKSRPEEHK